MDFRWNDRNIEHLGRHGVEPDEAEQVVAKAEEVVSTESSMRQALIGGMDPVAAYEKYGKF